jgi:hypothetical protein
MSPLGAYHMNREVVAVRKVLYRYCGIFWSPRLLSEFYMLLSLHPGHDITISCAQKTAYYRVEFTMKLTGKVGIYRRSLTSYRSTKVWPGLRSIPLAFRYQFNLPP